MEINRRDFIKAGGIVAGGLLAGCNGVSRFGKAKKPNVIFITTDQQHAKLMSCAGSKVVKTPNLDKLAKSGVRFENAYVANPVCVPCRYSMITGHMPHVFNELETNMKKDKTNLPKVNEYIDTPTMGNLFRDAGYETVYGGKLHVQNINNYNDEAEETFGFKCLSSDCKSELAEECSKFIKKKHDKPFMMWASFINPHDICKKFPFMGYNDMDHPYTKMCHKKQEKMHDKYPNIPLPDLPINFTASNDDPMWMKKFRDGGKEMQIGLNDLFGSHAKDWPEKIWQEYRWIYHRYMEMVDAQIGKVLTALKESGKEEETIVIFTSDHGDHEGSHGLTMKRTFYENSANVPLIISWKNHIKPGIVDKTTLVNNCMDTIPTICDLIGIKPPKELKGNSFSPLSDNKSNDFVVSETYQGRMLRTSDFKYNVYYYKGKSEEQLFDMNKDRLEMRNLAKLPEYKKVIKEHRAELKQWTIDNNDRKGKKYLTSF